MLHATAMCRGSACRSGDERTNPNRRGLSSPSQLIAHIRSVDAIHMLLSRPDGARPSPARSLGALAYLCSSSLQNLQCNVTAKSSTKMFADAV